MSAGRSTGSSELQVVSLCLGRVVVEKIVHGLEPQKLTRLAHARRRAWRRSVDLLVITPKKNR
jgi:hypothetical protein